MKHLLCYSSYRSLYGIVGMLFLYTTMATAQQSNLNDNQFTPIVDPIFGSLTVTSSTTGSPLYLDLFSAKDNLIDANTSNATSWTALVAGTAWIEVEDGAATGGLEYPGGSYAGFVVEDNGILSVLSSITITTYLNGSIQESSTGASLLSLGILSGKARVGFYTDPSKDFDKIRLTASTVGLLNNVTVYHAEVGKFDVAGPQSMTWACNTNIFPTNPDYPVIVNPVNTGISGGISVGSITNPDRAVDNDLNNYASLNLIVSAGGSGSFSIKDQVTDYPAGTFAGMNIDNPSIFGAGLLSNLTITTYLDGAQRDQVSNTNLLSVPSSLLSGTGRQIVGFVTTQSFDEVQITLNNTVNLGTTRIYGMVLKKFCSKAIPDCNTLTPGTNPDYPVYVNGANTGVDVGACVGCSINYSENVIDNDEDNYASVVFTGGVATSISFSVANALDDYDANTFVGFDLGIIPILGVDLLSSATIELFKDGSSVQSPSTGALLAGVTSTLLPGGYTRQPVGIIATVPFDEVKITFSQTLAVNLGTIRIYNALFTTTCAGTLSCDETNYLIGSKDDLPVYINSERTGTFGAVTALTMVSDPWNVVNDVLTDFADVQVTAGVAGTASISVVDATNTYPAGTIAGFVISDEGALSQLDLFNTITITTYLNGAQQESRSGQNLLDLDLLGLIVIAGAEYQPSFLTTLPFNEVRISFSSLVGVLNHVHVFSAFTDLRYVNDGGSYTCNIGTFNPDFNATWINVTVYGNVSTNDQPDGSPTYGTPVPVSGNPSGGMLHMNSNGTYDFTSANPGVYNYNVPVCVGTTCTSRLLQITVLDGDITTNSPVPNPDYGMGQVGHPIVLNSVANDGPGNEGIDLDTTSVAIITQPSNGSASVDGNTGVITYTPDPGFTGRDSLEYKICDKTAPPNSICATAWQYFTVFPDGLDNTTDATDDFVSTPYGMAASGNVSTNDTDPEGNSQTVQAQNTTITGKGTLVLNTDGTYTFTPVSGFSGPVDFTYTTCDNGSPSACASATLHILVEESIPDLSPIINSRGTMNQGDSRDAVITIYNGGQAPTSGIVEFGVFKLNPQFSINIDPLATSVIIITPVNVENSRWNISDQGGYYLFSLKPGNAIPVGGSLEVGITLTATGISKSTGTLNVAIFGGTGGGESPTDNNTAFFLYSIN